MIVRIVKLSLDPGQITQFLKYYNDVKEAIRSCEGCRHTELLTDVSGGGIVFTYSLWDAPEYLEKYRQSELFKTTWALVKPLFIARAEAWTLDKQESD
jgi:(4S)-4-hydroxy-5-phosphonooxypentane-2,3-dione isomerase